MADELHPLKPSVSTVASAGLGIPLGIILVYVVDQVLKAAGLEMLPSEVASALGSVVSILSGYFFVGGRAQDTADEVPDA